VRSMSGACYAGARMQLGTRAYTAVSLYTFTVIGGKCALAGGTLQVSAGLQHAQKSNAQHLLYTHAFAQVLLLLLTYCMLYCCLQL
jgi:hypothetical protein